MDLKTLRKRPAGETDRRPLDDDGGARPVLLEAGGSVYSSLPELVVSDGKVEVRAKGSESSAAGVRMSWRWSAWTSGDDVVR